MIGGTMMFSTSSIAFAAQAVKGADFLTNNSDVVFALPGLAFFALFNIVDMTNAAIVCLDRF